MIIIAYFFLLYLCEETRYKSKITPYRFEDVTFSYSCHLFAATTTEDDLQNAIFSTLTSTSQNNGVRGEHINHKASGDPLLCPKATLLRRTHHLCKNTAPLSTPLSQVMMPNGMWKNITPTMIYITLKTTVKFFILELGFDSYPTRRSSDLTSV